MGDVEPEVGLGRRVGRSFGWAVAGQAVQRVASLLSTLVLARFLLDGQDFGIFSIAVTINFFVLALNDLGVTVAVVREQDEAELRRMLPTARTLVAGTSLALYAVLFLAAPAVVGLFAPPAGSHAVGIVRLLSFQIVVDGLVALPAALLTRALRERTRTIAELAGTAVSVSVMLGVAAAGGGAWSLAAGQLAGVTVAALLLLAASPLRFGFGWQAAQARRLVAFGAPLIAGAAVGELLLNTDYVIVNRYLGASIAGAYFIAFNISNWPVAVIAYVMRRSAVAGFARLSSDPSGLERGFTQSLRLLLTATLPMALLIGVLAREVLEVLYGGQWLVAVTPLQFLAGISVLRLVFSLAMGLQLAVGRPVAVLVAQAVWWVALTAAMVWGATRHGLVGVGAAQALCGLCVALPVLVAQLHRVGIRLAALARLSVRPLVGGAALVVACVAARSPFEPPVLRLLAGGTIGLVVYAAVVLPGSDLVPRRHRPVVPA